MSNRYIITELEFRNVKYLTYAVLDEKQRMMEVICERVNTESILGNIYIGKVKDVVLNLNAAFIEIGNGITCYYSMEDYKHPLFTKKIGKKPLCMGDELVVQVTKEAVKTKFPVVTTNLNFTGKYLVLTTENTSISVSSKLPKDKKAQLRTFGMELLKEERASANDSNLNRDFGIIFRTNACEADTEDITKEYQQLKENYFSLAATCIHKTPYSLLKREKPFYLKELEGFGFGDEDEIITDLETVFEELKSDRKFSLVQRRFYSDASYPLAKLYSLEAGIHEALSEKVWLKSGAYLVISPTEALTVIDVNSGKNVKGKNSQENFLKINKEAAIEIARQLRVRNISGICIVDFINMDTKRATDELMHTFRMALKEDRTPTNLIDITKLGLVELTRKKGKRSLAEQLEW